MTKYTPYEYLLIGIANAFGLDKILFEERIEWVNSNMDNLENLSEEADEPFMFNRLVTSLRDHQSGLPVDCFVGLDCTSSGPQLLALMTCDFDACVELNLINNGKRNDLYTSVATYMSQVTGQDIKRSDVKLPTMTTFYASTAEPKALLGDGTSAYHAFIKYLKTKLKGPYEAMLDMMSCHDASALFYSWTAPDGVEVHLPVMDEVSKKIEIDEYDHKTFTMVKLANKAKAKDRSLPANITQSLDSFVVRELIRRCNFVILPVHDCFYCHPCHMQELRETITKIYSEIPEMNLLQSILREVTGDDTLEYELLGDPKELSKLVLQAEYVIS